MPTNALATRAELLPDASGLETMLLLAKGLYQSGLLPRTITNEFAALAIIQKGTELGIPPMLALSNINMIEGKPSADAQLIGGLIYRDHGDDALDFIESTDTRATLRYKRRGWDAYREYSYTIEEAQKAQLTQKANWQKMPRSMLRARCITNVAHMAFQDTIGGLYSGEELGADVVVGDDGSERPTITVLEAGEVAPGRTGASRWNTAWHVAVKGTRFADDDTRHKYVAYVTGGRFDSLTRFLEQATDEEASALIRSIERRIEAEAQKAEPRPITLQAKLEAAVTQARMLGADYDLPPNLADMPDEDIQAALDAVSETLERLAVPA